MEQVRTVIVEDEEASLFMLKDELLPFQNIKIIGEFKNGKTGLEGINSLRPDLVFVDIEMPDLNGFQMLKRLEYQPVIIFCTGHHKYALEAWDYNATDFITKPVDAKRVAKAIEKALDDILHKQHEIRLRRQKRLAGFVELQWSDVSGKRTRYFSPDEIDYIEGDRDYLIIHIEQETAADLKLPDNVISIKKTMKQAAEEFKSHQFLQVHKSFLINLEKVQEWNKSAKSVKLKNAKIPIPIGRSFLERFQQAWQRLIQ